MYVEKVWIAELLDCGIVILATTTIKQSNNLTIK